MIFQLQDLKDFIQNYEGCFSSHLPRLTILKVFSSEILTSK